MPLRRRRAANDATKSTKGHERRKGWCKRCGRDKSTHIPNPTSYKGDAPGMVCNLVQLTDGHWVHASRVDKGGDLHGVVNEKFGKLKIAHRLTG